MVTKIKPIRVKTSNVGESWKLLWYQDKNTFWWNDWGSWLWDMQYDDFEFVEKTGSEVELTLRTKITVEEDFLVKVPTELKDGQTYVLRVVNPDPAFEMTFDQNITNPHNIDTTLTPDWTDQFVFLAVDWKLELQEKTWEGVWGWAWGSITGNIEDQTDLVDLLNKKQDKLHAWNWIKIAEKSNMQWPCPDGWHIPTQNEWQHVLDLLVNLWITMTQWARMKEVLLLAYNNYRARNTASQGNQRIMTYFWTCTPTWTDGVILCFRDTWPAFNPQFRRANACSIRPFKDTPLMPNDDDWTNLHWTLDAWIWRNASLSAISITYAWEVITLADKNLWATQVSGLGDSPTNANSGNYYQRWNNYGFPWVETNVSQITKSSTLVDTTGYWPDNWYSSNVFVTSDTAPFDWSSPKNDNLWWWLGTETRTVIENTGVLSVNWQTGHVIVAWADTNTKVFKLQNSSDLATATNAYLYFKDWNYPILYWNNADYMLYTTAQSSTWAQSLTFRMCAIEKQSFENEWTSSIRQPQITIESNTTRTEAATLRVNEYFYWPRYVSTNETYTNSFTPTQNYHPATKKYVDDNASNTRTFFVWRNNDWITGAQEALDWYLSGNKNPILSSIIDGRIYRLYDYNISRIAFVSNDIYGDLEQTWNAVLYREALRYKIENDTITDFYQSQLKVEYSRFLSIDNNPITPYVPQYPGSPATKKYVDDKTVTSSTTAPTNPTAWQLWYDVTNKILKVYNWTAWEDISWDGVWDMQKSVYDPNNVWADAFDYDNFINTPALWTASEKDTGTSAGNIPVLDSNGKLNTSTLPWLALTDTFTVTNVSDLTWLTNAQQWDLWIVTSESKTYVLSADPYSTATNWKELLTPTDAVSSVNWKTGAVTLNADDINDSTTTNKFVTETEKDTWNDKQDELTAWNNIQINWTTISATDTTYTAWEWIEIKNWLDYSAMQWPAPDGFHVPLNTEWQAVYDIWTALGGWSSDWTNFGIALKLPFAGYRFFSGADARYQGSNGYYWSSSRYNTHAAYFLSFDSTNLNPQGVIWRSYGVSVRCFKNSQTVPTSSWTKLYWTSIEAGWIFWSSTDWLISLSSDWNTWITIADKNLGATTVWNSEDTLSEANCGKYYQRWNNYGFPRTWTIANQSTTQVDASAYWPWNYYSSDTFIKYNGRWDTTDNWNLWWWETWVVTLENAITNTWVLSVNGQTGDVVVDSNIKVFKLNAATSTDDEFKEAYDFYFTGGTPIIELTTSDRWVQTYVIGRSPVYNWSSTQDDTIVFVTTSFKETQYDSWSYLRTDMITMWTTGNNFRLQFTYTYTPRYLDLDVDYATPYTPQYDWSPATKKYVDDAVDWVNWIQMLPWSPVTKKYEWIWSEAEYQALWTYRTDTEYKIY